MDQIERQVSKPSDRNDTSDHEAPDVNGDDTKSANNDKMEVESENAKPARKKSSTSAKKKQKERNERFKQQYLHVVEEKPKLSREELKNLRAIQLIEKMEQKQRMKEENARKKVKLNQESVQNQLALEKSTSPDNNLAPEGKITILASPTKNQMIEESLPAVNNIETPKKVDNRALSKFLNPKIDLRDHSSLASFLQNYQSQQLELQRSRSATSASMQAEESKQETAFPSSTGLINEVKESFFIEQRSKLKVVSAKFAEYLQRKRREDLDNPLELIQGFRY